MSTIFNPSAGAGDFVTQGELDRTLQVDPKYTLESATIAVQNNLQTQINAIKTLEYQGTWNASTNTPTLVSSTGTQNYFYVVSTAGSTNLDGETGWNLSDWAVFNGTIWTRVPDLAVVASVAGKTGAVTLTTADIISGTFADARIAESNVTQHVAAIDHDALLNFSAAEHFTEASIDHANILNIGTNTHAQIDTHIADATLHFTEASIDHTNIQNVGTNTHTQLDTFITDNTPKLNSFSVSESGGALSRLGQVNGEVATYNAVASCGNYVYCATGTNIYTYDVSSPSSPTLVSNVSYTTGSAAENFCTVNCDWLFLARAGSNVVGIFDIATDPTTPALVNDFNTGNTVNGIYVFDDSNTFIVTQAGAGIEAFDSTNKLSIVSLDAHDHAAGGTMQHITCVEGDTAYVTTASDLVLYNISNLSSISDYGSINLDAFGAGAGARLVVDSTGNTAYVSWSNGWSAVDCTTRASPSHLARYDPDPAQATEDLVLASDTLLFVENSANGIYSYDVTTPASATLISTYTPLAGVVQQMSIDTTLKRLYPCYNSSNGIEVLSYASFITMTSLQITSTAADSITTAGGIEVTGNVTVSGTVDGRDVAADGTAQDNHIAATAAHGVAGDIVGTTDSQTLTSKILTDTSNNVTARALRSASTDVSTVAAAAPTNGQVLTATSGTTATWQDLTGNVENSTNLSGGTTALDSVTSGVENTAYGYDALTVVTTTNKNTAFGCLALSNSTGTRGTAVGYGAGENCSTGSDNIAFGSNAMGGTAAVTTAAQTIAIGNNALQNLTSGFQNVAIGYNSLQTASTAYGNVGVGWETLKAMDTGAGNIGIGKGSLISAAGGFNNIAIGWESLDAVVNGSHNIAFGVSALGAYNGSSSLAIGSNTLEAATGVNNFAIGYQAGQAIVGGTSNTALGYQALNANVSGNSNVCLGYQTLLACTGGNNVAIGTSTGSSLTTGSNNIIIGQGITGVAGESNAIRIGTQVLAGNTSGTGTSATGKFLNVAAATYNDTGAGGTVAQVVGNSIAVPTLTADAVTTTTDAASLYIAGAPAASTNQTITNAYALWVDSGDTRLDGNIINSAGATITLPTAAGTLATLAGTETLTNKTLTTPIISSISNTGTVTLPTATTTLVGTDTSDTLTNKTLTGNTCANLVNGSSATITLPTGVGARTLATVTGTETLTNKTLASPSVTGTISSTGALISIDSTTDAYIDLDRSGTTFASYVRLLNAGTVNWIIGMDNQPTDRNADFSFKRAENTDPPDGFIEAADGGLVWGDNVSQGFGTINADAVYDDGVLLTCMPIRHAMGETIVQKEWDSKVQNKTRYKNAEGVWVNQPLETTHHAAKQWLEEGRSKFNDVDVYCAEMCARRALPIFPTFDEWTSETKISTGDLSRRLWETVEYQALHIKQLNDRLKVLESK